MMYSIQEAGVKHPFVWVEASSVNEARSIAVESGFVNPHVQEFVPESRGLHREHKGIKMSLGMILLLVLVILLICGGVGWGNGSWGYQPVGLVGVLLIILVVLLLTGRI